MVLNRAMRSKSVVVGGVLLRLEVVIAISVLGEGLAAREGAGIRATVTGHDGLI